MKWDYSKNVYIFLNRVRSRPFIVICIRAQQKDTALPITTTTTTKPSHMTSQAASCSDLNPLCRRRKNNKCIHSFREFKIRADLNLSHSPAHTEQAEGPSECTTEDSALSSSVPENQIRPIQEPHTRPFQAAIAHSCSKSDNRTGPCAF